ncbi:MAG: alkaline phosphatase [Prevotella sp.]|jgi:predicted AlkP superfamily pyrophosphatase or phosphodiesterase|nr:alkaline phosphatase [Prevotella sp.]
MKKYFMLILSIVLYFSGIGAQTADSKQKRAGHVILIGLDGWGAYSVPKAEMPNVKKQMEQGCYTLTKRSVFPSSSAANWASMFMGAGPELHGYTEWGSKTPEFPSKIIKKNNIFPTIFQLLRDNDPKAGIACFYEWEGIKFLVDTISLDYHAQVPDYNKHPDALCEMSVKYILGEKPELLAVCFDNPDHTGHEDGHDTPAYYSKLRELDDYIGRIIKATEQAGIIDQTVFIITSDHGGIQKGHGGKTVAEMETPFIIAGKGIKRGGCFEESMMQFDIASTIAYIFALKQPQVWIGRPMLNVFEK